MPEAIDSLLVQLGLDTDEQSFKEADRQFSSLKTTALQFGAAIGAGFGLNALTMDFSEAVDEMTRFGEVFSVAPEFIDQLGFAFQQTGGDASDAMSSIRGVADLIEQTEWGEIPSDAFREFGVDPMILQGVESITEAYERLMGATSNLDPETARRFFSSLGLSESDLRLAQGQGDQSFQALMDEAESRAELSQSMQDQAREFQIATGQLQRSMEGVSREISALFVGDIAEDMGNIADYLADNRDDIAEFADAALPYIKGMAAGIVALVSIQGARSALGIFQSIPGMTALVAGLGYGVYSAHDPQTSEEMTRERNVEQLQKRLDRLDQQIEMGEGVDGGERLKEQLESLRQERDDVRGMIRSRSDDPDLSMGPDSMNGNVASNTRLEFNIDARGSTDPAATREQVEQGVDAALARAAKNTLLDLQTGVS